MNRQVALTPGLYFAVVNFPELEDTFILLDAGSGHAGPITLTYAWKSGISSSTILLIRIARLI